MQRFTNILFVAGSAADDSSFNQAVTLAANNQALLTVAGIVDAPGLQGAEKSKLLEAMIAQRQEELQGLVASAPAGLQIAMRVLVGKPFLEIIREVLRNRRDLVIKSIESAEGMRRQLFGGTDMKLLRKCPCPVWLAKSTQQKGYREILVGLDYEPENAENEALNRQLLEMATSLALSESSELHVVHAWHLANENLLRSPRFGSTDEGGELHVLHAWHLSGEVKLRGGQIDMGTVENILSEMKAAHQSALDSLVEAYPYDKTEVHLIKGDAGDVISAFVEDRNIDLVVIGTVGRSGVPGLLIGNTAEKVLSTVDCSVLTIKPEGFRAPIEA